MGKKEGRNGEGEDGRNGVRRNRGLHGWMTLLCELQLASVFKFR